MTLYSIVVKNMRQRTLASVLTIVSIALGVALVTGILMVRGEAEDNFHKSSTGWDVIVGPKGSPLQLVLSAVFHVQQAGGKIKYSLYEEIVRDKRVQFAVPFCTGDTFQQFRIVATNTDFFKHYEHVPGKRELIPDGERYIPGETLEFAQGRPFGEELGEAVVGSYVATKSRLKQPGEEFVITHGMTSEAGDPKKEHEELPFKVVGVMKPTGMPVDKVIYVSLETWFALPEHAEGARDAAEARAARHDSEAEEEHSEHTEGISEALHTQNEHEDDDEGHAAGGEEHEHEHGPPPKELWELTSVGVRMTEERYILDYVWEMRNASTAAQAVPPLQEITMFFQNVLGWVSALFIAIACMVIIVSAIGIMVWIYNSMNERRREIAIMRSLGASRWSIVITILLESVTLCAVGALIGIPLAHLGVQAASGYIHAKSGAIIDAWRFSSYELLLLIGTTALGALVGIMPAFKAYRTDVAEGLSPLS